MLAVGSRGEHVRYGGLIGVVVLNLFYRNIRIPGVCLLEWKRLGLNEL